MKKKEWVAMLLAGGQGSRLGALTRYVAKPAVSFGGKYRIIDFSLSNCVHSGINTVGVLTQYKPMLLNSYIGTGKAWDLDEGDGGVQSLPPFVDEDGGRWYKGTANAIYQNLDFINSYDPDYVLIISGDHIYHMDYAKALAFHKKNQAEVTISVMEVPWEEASRFGIISTEESGRITAFAEKPSQPDSNLASMGIYIFNASLLRKALLVDEQDKNSENDFGKNVIPRLLKQKKRLFAYRFEGYWRDVGTIESYYEANMELLRPSDTSFHLDDSAMRTMTNSNIFPPHYIGEKASVKDSFICNGSTILGEVSHSILAPQVYVAEGASVKDSILLPGVRIEAGSLVKKSIIGEKSLIEPYCTLGIKAGTQPNQSGIVVVADHSVVAAESMIEEGRNIVHYMVV